VLCKTAAQQKFSIDVIYRHFNYIVRVSVYAAKTQQQITACCGFAANCDGPEIFSIDKSIAERR
jgi:hypothetical protein